jgi:hypothetical protein
MNDLSRTPAVPAPVIQRTDYRPPEWLVPEIALDFALSLTATNVRAELVVERSAAASSSLRLDGDGIAADDEVVLAFDTIADRPPTATIAEPLQDESIVVDARIDMRADARDDIALVKSGIEIATRIGKSAAESLVFEEPAETVAGAAGVVVEAGVERTLDVARFKLEAGDSIVLRGYAEDGFRAEGPTDAPAAGADGGGAGDAAAGHGRIRSAPRILRIPDSPLSSSSRLALSGQSPRSP